MEQNMRKLLVIMIRQEYLQYYLQTVHLRTVLFYSLKVPCLQKLGSSVSNFGKSNFEAQFSKVCRIKYNLYIARL